MSREKKQSLVCYSDSYYAQQRKLKIYACLPECLIIPLNWLEHGETHPEGIQGVVNVTETQLSNKKGTIWFPSCEWSQQDASISITLQTTSFYFIACYKCASSGFCYMISCFPCRLVTWRVASMAIWLLDNIIFHLFTSSVKIVPFRSMFLKCNIKGQNRLSQPLLVNK